MKPGAVLAMLKHLFPGEGIGEHCDLDKVGAEIEAILTVRRPSHASKSGRSSGERMLAVCSRTGTLDEIGSAIGLCVERVRQLRFRAIRVCRAGRNRERILAAARPADTQMP
jgi:hypothetical protein